MKKIIIGIIVVFGFLLLNNYIENRPFYRCNTTVDFDISDSDRLKEYVMNNVWTVVEIQGDSEYIKGKRVHVNINDNLIYSIWVGVYEDEELNDALNNIGLYGSGSLSTASVIQYHDTAKRYPYYESGKWGNNFIEIAEDHYTMEYCESSKCTIKEYRKDERAVIDFDGTYKLNGKTLVIDRGDLYYVESDRHYTIYQTDQNRITINGQIISEIPSYRFWIDEEGNIILFSDGVNVYNKSEEEISEEYPFYVLEKQK